MKGVRRAGIRWFFFGRRGVKEVRKYNCINLLYPSAIGGGLKISKSIRFGLRTCSCRETKLNNILRDKVTSQS